MDTKINITLVILVGIVISIAWIAMIVFRNGIKEGDHVGVRFGDEVYMRTIKRVTVDHVMVYNQKMTHLVFVHKNQVFLKDNSNIRNDE